VSHHLQEPSRAGAVVLDIGAGVGALILNVPAAWHAREIDISGTDGHRTHAAVRERVLGGGSLYSVVYPALPEGEYTIWTDRNTPAGTATVTGGDVTYLDWTDRA
jgi:hypothetical protein